MKAVIRQAEKDGDAKITAWVLTHFKKQGFELVAKKDVKAMEKLNKLYKSQIADLVHDNWEIQMRLYEVELIAKDPENTNVEASKFGEETLISTQARTAGLRQGAEANEQEAISAIMKCLDNHIDEITKVLDRAELTRIKANLDEQDRLLDEPMDQIDDPALDEAVDLHMYYLQLHRTPYLARLTALLFVKQKVEDSGYDHYWIDVYNYLKLLKYTM